MQGLFDIHKLVDVTHHTNGFKDRSHMIVSTGVAKAFDKFQYPFMIKTPGILEMEGTYLSITKAISDKIQSPSCLMEKNLKPSH